MRQARRTNGPRNKRPSRDAKGGKPVGGDEGSRSDDEEEEILTRGGTTGLQEAVVPHRNEGVIQCDCRTGHRL